ncbi:GGDEF domain-containing protein [Tindallia magadiensis]|uniref:GGDEF domain-containing protein n=1 Tax=Tindallia magadiensis TaxID=69895 RepID=UPI0015A65DD5|nr:GGDEF domain-containing protein [Tindallia magadiensis]
MSIAKYSSPLTGLPGNKLINEELLKALSKESCSVLYFDLDYFKAYNDQYGFEKGDQVIRLLAQIIQKNLLQGYLLSVNRKGEKECFPLVSVSIAVLPIRKNRYQSLEALTEAAAFGKKLAKNMSGSSYYTLTNAPEIHQKKG